MAYGHLRDLRRGAASDKVLHDTFNIPRNPKYDEKQRGLASMVIAKNFLIKSLLLIQE